jgi:extradiol dioxygenase family protein
MPFHLAVPVHDLEVCRRFYRDIMGFAEGRSAASWVDFDFYGHQFVIHLQSGMDQANRLQLRNSVDGHDVPLPHYGVVLEWHDWETLAARLEQQGIEFVVKPGIRFQGLVGEQATMFFLDPAGNALEFKAFKDMQRLFAK